MIPNPARIVAYHDNFMQPPSIPLANEVFHQYLVSTEAEQEEWLARLVVDFAQPLVTRVIRRRLSGSRSISAEDVEDVCSEALASLVPRLRVLRGDPAAVDVADFESYVAGLASHVAFQFFARRFPEKSRLRNRIRYVLTTDPRFRISKADEGTPLCSLARRGDHCAVVPDSSIEAVRLTLSARSLPVSRLPDLLFAVLSEIPGAVEIGDLTSLMADLLGVDDRADLVENMAERLADPRAAHSHRVELRDSLRVLWGEITQLPLTQRAALLLNLRSSMGACLWLLIELRVVAFRDLAACLGLTGESLAAIWNRLPLEDSEIATRLGLKRQQVINMRSAARQRLGRRMESREQNATAGNKQGNLPTR
jgi:hypothetical protein